jgi:transposase
MNDWPPQIWGLFIAVVGAVSGWVGRISNNRADAAAVLTDGALKMVHEFQEELTNLRTRQTRLEMEQRLEREWCDLRISQLVTALHLEGIEVPPPPARPDYSS